MSDNPQNVKVNARVLKFDQLLQGIEEYASSIRTRTDSALSEDNICSRIEEIFGEEESFNRLVAAIVTRIGINSIVNGVVRQTQGDINEKIDATISSKLSEEPLLSTVNRLIQMHANGQEISIPDINQNRKIEDIPLDSPENIAEVCRLLAGADAIL
jgi:hypothetical protein